MKLHTVRLLVAGLLVVVLAVLYSVPRERIVPFGSDVERARWHLIGDEPAYLLTAQAIAAGHGEDVSRVHAAQTYTNFWPAVIIGPRQWTWKNYRDLGCPYLWDRSASWGEHRQVIQRPPLTAAFAAPFAHCSNPRWFVLVALEAFAILCAVVLLWGAADAHASVPWCGWALLCFFSAPPTLFYTCAIYPEILVGCLAAMGLFLCRSKRPGIRALAIGLLLVCPWGTGRVIPAVAITSLLLLWREIKARNLAGIAVFLIGWALYEGYTFWLWGYPVPPAPPNGGTLTLSQMRLGILHTFFGNNIGLFFLCPVAAMGLFCLGLLLWKHRNDPATVPTLLFLACAAAVVASFSNPRAGICPAGRYQVILGLVLLVPVLVFLIVEPGHSAWRRRVCFLLSIFGALSIVSGTLLLYRHRWWFVRSNPIFLYKEIHSLYAYLPDFAHSWKRPLAGWVLLFVVLAFLPDVFHICQKRRKPQLTPGTSQHTINSH